MRVTLAGGEIIETSVLIGADGQKSRVREAAGITHRIKPYPQAAITCRLKHPKDHEDVSLEFHTREGPFTFVPVGENLSALVWIMQPEKAEAMLALSREAFAEAITRRSSAALGTVSIEGPIASVPLQKLVADRLFAGRIALVGEAAHAFPPIGAQGLNLGLKDVEALVKRLIAAKAAGEDLASALPAYARDRKFDVEARSMGVDILNSALIADLLPFDIARAAGSGGAARCRAHPAAGDADRRLEHALRRAKICLNLPDRQLVLGDQPQQAGDGEDRDERSDQHAGGCPLDVGFVLARHHENIERRR